MWRYALTLSAMLLVFSGSALAVEKPTFKEADQNGDNMVSIQEAVKAGVPRDEAKFNDLDGDGKLAKSDWRFVDMNKPSDQSSMN